MSTPTPSENHVLRLLRTGPVEGRPAATEQVWAGVEQGAGSETLVLERVEGVLERVEGVQEQDEDTLRVTGGTLAAAGELGGAWRTRWPGLGASLGVCVPDPLALPPAGDPSGTRLLEQDGSPGGSGTIRRRWVVVLSGDNPCRLSGELRLAVTGNKVDAKGLSVSGLPWTRGGRELARDNARGELRRYAEQSWDTLDPTEQEALLRALREDPLAGDLVERLGG